MNIQQEIDNQKLKMVELTKTIEDATEKIKLYKVAIKKLEKALNMAQDAVK